jgi:hypothetical protein
MTATEDEKILVRLEEKINGIDEKIDGLQDKVFGNGKPGLLVDQITQSKEITMLVKYAADNASNIEKLKEISTPTWIAKNWMKILGVFVAVLLIVHSFIPEGMTLWQLFALVK